MACNFDFFSYSDTMSGIVASIQALEADNARLKKQLADMPTSITILVEAMNKLEAENYQLKVQIASFHKPTRNAVHMPWGGDVCTCDDTNGRCRVHD